MEEKIKNERVEKFTRAAQTLLELMQQIDGCTNEKLRGFYIEIADGLEAEIMDAFEVYKENLIQEGLTVGEYVVKLKPFIDVLRAYQELKEGNAEDVSFIGLSQELQQEVNEGLKHTQETGNAYHEDNPLLKELVKRNTTGTQAKSPVTIAHKNDLIITRGNIGMYGSEILNNLAKCLREGHQTTTSGKGYLTIGQLYKWMSGGAKDALSEVQSNEIRTALEEMSSQRIGYITNEELADILGLEVDGELADFKVEEADEQLIKCDFYKGTIRGQKATLVVFEFARIINRMMEKLSWYEVMPQDIKCIQYQDKNGKLKTWSLTKQRIELRACIFNFVISYIRARAAKKNHSNCKPYDDIFRECEIDISHRETRKRRQADIAVILDHLQRKGVISKWEEYSNRGSKRPDGIKVFLSKELIGG